MQSAFDRHSYAPGRSRDSSLESTPIDFTEGLFQGAIEQPWNGLAQLTHLPAMHVFEGNNRHSLANAAGVLVGNTIDFIALARVTKFGLGSISAANVAQGAIGSGIEMGLIGALWGGVLTPQTSDSVATRLKAAVIDGATFATMGGASSMMEPVSALTKTLVTEIKIGAASGAAGGLINVLGSSAMERRLPSASDMGGTIGSYAAFGALFALGGHLIDTSASSPVAVTDLRIPSYVDLKAQMASKGLSAGDILRSCRKRNFINDGHSSVVYNIPRLPEYVCRVPKSCSGVATKSPILEAIDPAPAINFGQPVATIDGQIQVLKRVAGEPYGTFCGRRAGRHFGPAALSELHITDVRTAAAMPQSAYDHLASQLHEAAKRGLRFDSVNPNNILVDNVRQQFNPIDFDSVAAQSRPVEARVNDMIGPLVSNRNGPPLKALEANELKSLHDGYRVIIEKSMAAAKKYGLGYYTSDWILMNTFEEIGISDEQSAHMINELSHDGKSFSWGISRNDLILAQSKRT